MTENKTNTRVVKYSGPPQKSQYANPNVVASRRPVFGLEVSAQSTSNSYNITTTPPGFYAPQHTASAWQIPTNRKEVYAWSKYWLRNEALVATGLDFYSSFSMNGYKLECPNGAVKEYFEKLCREKIQLDKWLPQIAYEYYAYGDCFVLLEMDCPTCHGTGNIPDNGRPCEHEGATWGGLSIFDPNTIEVSAQALGTQDPVIEWIPNDQLVDVCIKGKPEEIYNQIPPEIRERIKTKQKIKLNPIAATHLKFAASPYETYGTSLIRRLFPTLAYRDKLRQAQWMVVDRHILPIKIVKVGSDQRPASEDDLAAVQEQLSQVANDPLLTLVVHHAFDLCYSSDTEVLTENGWKFYDDVSDFEKIMIFDTDTEKMYYSNFKNRFKFEAKNREMINFKSSKMDVCVTKHHKMLIKKGCSGEWHTDIADNVKSGDHFRAVSEWKESPGNDIDSVCIYDNLEIEINKYLEYVGWYLSEGYTTYKKETRQYRVSISQSKYSQYYSEINNMMLKFGIKYHKYEYENKKVVSWDILNKKLAIYFKNNFGSGCFEKNIPSWIKNLPKNKLKTILESMMKGDGRTQIDNQGYKVRYRIYHTVSKQLANDVQEIVFKLGYAPLISEFTNECGNQQYRVSWSEQSNRGKYPKVKSEHKNYVERNDFVWCFETETGFFVTRRNGKITIQGNSFEGSAGKVLMLTDEYEMINEDILSGFQMNKALVHGEGPNYASAQVGLDALAARLNTFRNQLKHWIEQKIFKPVSEWNNFTSVSPKGIEEIIYPEIVFNDLGLKENNQEIANLLQLRQRNEISLQTLLSKFDIDYDTEVELLKQEEMGNMLTSPDLGLGVQEGGEIGAGGGMPPMVGGAMPTEMPGAMGEGAPAPAPGMPGAMDMGVPGGAPPPVASVLDRIRMHREAVSQAKKFVAGSDLSLEESIREIPDDLEMIDFDPDWQPFVSVGRDIFQMARFAGKDNKKQDNAYHKWFNKAEMALFEAIMKANQSGQLPFASVAQYYPYSQNNLSVDLAFPGLKIAIEVDGKTWHQSIEQVERDKKKDQTLWSMGWIVLRFTEDEVKEKIDQVMKVITRTAMERHQGKNQSE